MALNINGTTGISGVDGSASAPAVTGTDSNTGINFGSDTVNINTGGTTRATVDSAGRLLLGTTTEGHTSGDDLTIATSGTTGITLRSGTSDGGRIFFSDGTSGDDEYRGVIGYDHSTNHLYFSTNASERMRINSSGTVLIGTTSSSNSDNALEVRNSNSGGALGVTSSNSSNQQDFILFKVGSGNTANGGIRRDGSTNGVELFSGSDRRIKKNILDMDNVLDKINKLSLKKFDFKQGGSGVGVIAQDLISIFPNKVKKDDSDDGTGDTIPDGVEAWTVGHNFTYELLKAVQELSAKVETLETKVAALEGG